MFVYYASFRWLNAKKKQYPFIELKAAYEERALLVDQHNAEAGLEETDELTGMDRATSFVHPEVANVALNCTTGASIGKRAFPLIINLCTVYFLEYCIISCFADRMQIFISQ